jgi:hypothetical protein
MQFFFQNTLLLFKYIFGNYDVGTQCEKYLFITAGYVHIVGTHLD